MESVLSSDKAAVAEDAKRFIQHIVESDETFCVDFDVLWRLCGHSRKDVAVRALKNLVQEGYDYIFKKGGALHDDKGRIVRKLDNSYILSIRGFETFTVSVHKQRGHPLLHLFVETELKAKGMCGPQLKSCTEEALLDIVSRVAASRGLVFKPDGHWKTHPVHTEYECNERGDIWSIRNYRLLSNKPDDDGYITVFVNNVTYRAHRFIYEAFAEQLLEKGLQVHHVDANPSNNSISNLEALTTQAHCTETRRANPQMNLRLGATMGKAVIGVHRLTGEKRSFSSACLAARELGINQANISRQLLHDQCSHVRQWVFEYDQAYLKIQEDIEGEEWRIIPLEGPASIGKSSYNLSKIRVSDMGRVRDRNGRKSYGVNQKDALGANPYMGVGAGDGRFFVHTLVALAFIGPRPTPDHTIDHVDRIRHNNIPLNLRWADMKEQAANRETSVPVLQVDPHFRRILRRYDTLSAAAQAVGKTKEAVRVASVDPQKTCAGFMWWRA
jgi:hypothetical protein